LFLLPETDSLKKFARIVHPLLFNRRIELRAAFCRKTEFGIPAVVLITAARILSGMLVGDKIFCRLDSRVYRHIWRGIEVNCEVQTFANVREDLQLSARVNSFSHVVSDLSGQKKAGKRKSLPTRLTYLRRAKARVF
jgi:hypothetical protein